MRNIPVQSLVTLLQPEEFNDIADELENIITSAGITLSQSDLFQLGKAVATYSAGGDFYTDSGAADAYVLSAIGSKQTPEEYFDGMRIRFLPENANTGASTINVNSLGVINIKKADGVSDPAAGDISTTELQLTYDGTNFRIVELGGASATSSVTLDVNQATHGFSVNDIIRVSGGAYTEAQADTVANAQAIGVVVAQPDADNFTVQFSGFTNLLTGLSANTLHYLDASTPGANTTTEPTISKPIIFAVSSTTGWILPQRPIDTTVAGGITSSDYVTNGFAQFADDLLLQWGTTASISRGATGATINFPTTFPTACLQINGSILSATGSGSNVHAPLFNILSTTQFDVFVGGNSSGSFPVFWSAIGH